MVKNLAVVSKVSLFATLLIVAAVTANSFPFKPDNYTSKDPIEKSSNEVPVSIQPKGRKSEDLGMKFLPTGSSLPDCMHACGACNPCKRVMVSFECSIAESCPVVYRCVCKGKYYHVPSS